jgi:trigger factor
VKSAVETLSPTRAKLTVEVPFEELKPSLDAAYKKIAQQINVPGFRKGKVPPMVIDRQIGRGPILDEAINDALPKLYVQALQENSIEPLAQPDIDITKFEDNETLEFTAEVDVRPEITLPELEGLEVTVDDVEVTDEDVDTQVQSLRERFASLNDVDRPAAENDFVTIDLKAMRDGEVVEGAEVSGMSYQVGRGGMLDGLDEALTGMSAGDEKTFESNLVGGDQTGLDVEVEVKVTAVKEQELPELDEEFAQTASEFDTVDELLADVRTRLERGKRLEQAAAARDAVLEKILDLVEIPLPDAVVDEELKARRENVQQQLMYAGMTLEAYLESEEQTLEEFESDLGSAPATRSLRSSSSTRSPRRKRSASSSRSCPSTSCAARSSPGRTRTSSPSTWSSTTTSPRWSPRSCAARRSRSWSRPRRSSTSPATTSS